MGEFVFLLFLSQNSVAAPALAPQVPIVSQAQAEIGEHVITSREVQISWVVEQALFATKSDKLDRRHWLVQIGDNNFNTQLQQVMTETLVRQEAESFSVAQVGSDLVKKDLEHILALVETWAEWKKWEVTDSELEAILLRRRIAKQFLKFKNESSGVVVRDEEAKEYFEKNRYKFGSAPFAQFKDTIKEVLAQKQLEEKLKDWFEILQRKYKVRRLKAPAVTPDVIKN